ncbi:4Fe-4S dicluster domain-containing protein [Nitrospirillum viridazoti]|uniref:Ferredoxin n=1 Tax=Nitrospirillum viridazoti CBAmc TaxID=1441467 RepID=A0A248JXK5_9PROT|nr:ferredoxin family protein [Nitrospirillum amazonense]ASG22858.1 ferredoxin [Nitrospirillum amazonense CBAmc]TWB33680.1 NAD-dependent dihydropyrimidine dehydrogenase PreA subunit [Nitrospirillum amazonense]
MIELVVDDRCTRCDTCIQVCPTNVFERGAGGLPLIARQEDCQTCFLCELYCQADALYVAPNCDEPVAVDAASIVASGLLGQFRRHSGWHEWEGDPAHANLHWRMGELFARARAG